MLILLATHNPLRCRSINGNPAIAVLFNGSRFSEEQKSQAMGKSNVVSTNLSDRIFRLIHIGLNPEAYVYIDSGRCRQKPEPT